MALKDILPLLVQKKTQRDKIEAEQARNKKLSESFLRLKSATTPAERDSINAQIIAQGGNPGQQAFNPSVDYTQAFEIFNIDPSLQPAVNMGIMTFKRAMEINKANNPAVSPLTDENAQILFDALTPEEQKRAISPSHMVAVAGIGKFMGKAFANKITGVEAEDKLDEIFARIDSGEIRSMGELDSGDRSRVIAKFKSTANQNAIFDKKADIPKLLSEGRKSIQGNATLLFNDLDFANTFDKSLPKWKNDILEDGAKKDYFDKYYNKLTGEIDGDALVAEGRNQFELQEKLRKNLTITDRERNIVTLWVNQISTMRSPEDTKDDIRREYEALIESGQVSFNKRLLKLILEGLEE